MSLENIYQAKQLIASVHDIANSMQLIHTDISSLAKSINQIEAVIPDLKEFTESALVELQQARVTIEKSCEIANNLYHIGLDASKECES